MPLQQSTDSPADAGALPPRLSDTGLYVAGSVAVIRPGIIPYAPQYPLWADGARKRRWMYLPAGTSIDASHPDDWVFPIGTRFWKEFAFGDKRVETRTIERLPDGGWRFASYIWSSDGTDAHLAPDAGVPAAVEIRAGAWHRVPARTDCLACHEGRENRILGFSLLQLPSGHDDRTIEALVDRGVIRGLPPRLATEPPRIAAPSPTARAALGYLHANCGGCHNAQGPLAVLGLTLDYRVAENPGEFGAPALASTWGRESRFRMPGTDENSRRLVPGRPDLSVLTLRMRSRDPLVQMPPLGTVLVDDAGAALVERWIAELAPSPLETQNQPKETP